ncbi:MAG: hypothetical protein AAF393_01725 [Pseudomonadota bacterium]
MSETGNSNSSDSELGALGLAVFAVGLILSYLACLHESAYGIWDWVAFLILVFVFGLVAALVEWISKLAVVLGLLLFVYSCSQNSAEFQKFGLDVKVLHTGICAVTNENYPDVSALTLVCPMLRKSGEQ